MKLTDIFKSIYYGVFFRDFLHLGPNLYFSLYGLEKGYVRIVYAPATEIEYSKTIPAEDMATFYSLVNIYLGGLAKTEGILGSGNFILQRHSSKISHLKLTFDNADNLIPLTCQQLSKFKADYEDKIVDRGDRDVGSKCEGSANQL